MPVRRPYERIEVLGQDCHIRVRWVIEAREVVHFAVLLQVLIQGRWHNVRLYDCSHQGQHDLHRYSREGEKGPAENFHHGTTGEAFRAALNLIRDEHERMIREWRF